MVEKHWHGTHIVQTPANATHAIRVTMDAEGAFHSQLVPARRGGAMTQAQAALRGRL